MSDSMKDSAVPATPQPAAGTTATAVAALGRKLSLIAVAIWAIGAVLLIGGSRHDPARLWGNLLIAGVNLTTVGLGGLFLLAVQILTRAHWSDPLLKVHRALPRLFPFAMLILLSVALFASRLYPWAKPGALADPILRGRAVWLNPGFFGARIVCYFTLWMALGYVLTRRQRFAAPFMVVFALSFSLAQFDWLMSLEPAWYSTLFAFYGFSGMFLQTLAILTFSAILLRRLGLIPDMAKTANHDLGLLLFAFSSFWAYLWFSQFLLIWYSNLPEETGPVRLMLRPDWLPLHALNIALNWALPFSLLLTRKAKLNEKILLLVALSLLAGHWLDTYLLVFAPVLGGGPPQLGWPELGGLLTALGLGHLACWPAFSLRRPAAI